MSDILSRRVSTLLVKAAQDKWVQFEAKIISARVRAAVRQTEIAGFHFTGRVQISDSKPYLIAFAQCHAAYSDYTFPAELRVWEDGAIHIVVRCNGDNSLGVEKSDVIFWLRTLASGCTSQAINFHKILHKGGKKNVY